MLPEQDLYEANSFYVDRCQSFSQRTSSGSWKFTDSNSSGFVPDPLLCAFCSPVHLFSISEVTGYHLNTYLSIGLLYFRRS